MTWPLDTILRLSDEKVKKAEGRDFHSQWKSLRYVVIGIHDEGYCRLEVIESNNPLVLNKVSTIGPLDFASYTVASPHIKIEDLF